MIIASFRRFFFLIRATALVMLSGSFVFQPAAQPMSTWHVKDPVLDGDDQTRLRYLDGRFWITTINGLLLSSIDGMSWAGENVQLPLGGSALGQGKLETTELGWDL